MAAFRSSWALARLGMAVCAVAVVVPLASCGVRAPRTEAAPAHAPTASTTAAHHATPTVTATPKAGTTPTPSAGTGGTYAFPLIPPGGTLPSEATCASLVQPSSWEPRPDNTSANHTVPTSVQLDGVAPWNEAVGVDPRADAFRKEITGHYTGTTDEILQWVACKWGVPVDVVRAEAVVELYLASEPARRLDDRPGVLPTRHVERLWVLLELRHSAGEVVLLPGHLAHDPR